MKSDGFILHALKSLMFCLCCTSASAEPFTYQGQLFFDGMIAEGQFDLECRLFDADTEGTQVGSTIVLDDHVVPNGLLQMDLDFGDVFDASDLYLEISVRYWESEEAYEVLVPRHLIKRAPKAFHALVSDSVRGEGWSADAGGTLSFGSGAGQMEILSDETENVTEYIGLQLTDLEGGGIVINNDDPMGDSIFAFAKGGIIKASQAFDGELNQWQLRIGTTPVVSADSSGVTATNYKFSNPKSGAVTIAGDLFHSTLDAPFFASIFNGGAFISQAGSNSPMVAPVQLPHGATITGFIARFEDNYSGADLSVSLKAAGPMGSPYVAVADVISAGSIAGLQTLTDSEIENAVVDNTANGYFLRVFCPSWPGDDSMRIWSVTIQYTTEGPD